MCLMLAGNVKTMNWWSPIRRLNFARRVEKRSLQSNDLALFAALAHTPTFSILRLPLLVWS